MSRYLMLFALLAVGCGGQEDGGFLGTWKGCTVSWMCNGMEVGDADGDTVISSVGGMDIEIMQPNGMPSTWTVNGNQATIYPGTGGGDPDPNGVKWDVTFSPGTLTLNSNGVMTGGCAGTGSYKTPASCTYNFGCIATKE